jgi:hypothetical protein
MGEVAGVLLYSFVSNDPVAHVDALGLTPCGFVTSDSNGGWVGFASSGGGYSVDGLGVILETASTSAKKTTGTAHLEKGTVTKNWLGLMKCVEVRVYVALPQDSKKLSEMKFPTLPYTANQGFGHALRVQINFHVGFAPHAPLGENDSAISGGFYEVLLAHEKGHLKPLVDHLPELQSSIEALAWYAAEQDVDNAISTFWERYKGDSNKMANEYTLKYMDAEKTFERVKQKGMLIRFPEIDDGFVFQHFWKK